MNLLSINLPMDMRDLNLWESGKLAGFAIPQDHLPEANLFFGFPIGIETNIVNILEPFKRLTVQTTFEKNGKEITQRVTAGIIYRSDGKTVWDGNMQIPHDECEEAEKWSPAYQLPDYAIRRRAIVLKAECAQLQCFTKDQIRLLELDYQSQNDPQLIMDEFEPQKDLELLYKWWKSHYKASLRNGNNPNAVILHL